MKRFGVILAVQLVVIAAAAFFGSWAFARWHGTPAKPAGDEMAWFRSQLGLNADQSARLEKIHQQFLDEQSKLCEQHCAKRFKLGELIKQSDSVTPRVEQLTRDLAEIEAKSQRLTIEHIFDVGKQLNASQREQFVSKLYDQICTSCPMGSHKPAPGKRASCESPCCGCCVASAWDEVPPIQPLANLSAPEPRLDLFPTGTPLAISAPLCLSRDEFDHRSSASRRTVPLFVILSVFRI